MDLEIVAKRFRGPKTAHAFLNLFLAFRAISNRFSVNERVVDGSNELWRTLASLYDAKQTESPARQKS